MNSLVLTYIPGVCVFPARSGFTPGWAYLLVGGCAGECFKSQFIALAVR